MYHALTPENIHIALKIFKTSILIFKDRDRYVTGERRFRHGYSKHNPRKMVRLWAEKEMRNLKRLVAAGIPCPEPIEVRENILVMGFLGTKSGWHVIYLYCNVKRINHQSRASPRLKDADIPEDHFSQLYVTLLLAVRRMFHHCKLVHADLSEYNILYHNSQLYIIDVGQSVEHDHPSAFDFLRSDLKNIEDFFGRRGVRCVGLRRAFEFIISETTDEGDEESWLRRLIADERELDTDEKEDILDDQRQGHEKQSDDKVFMQSYIPRTLNEVYDPERDVDLVSRGTGQHLIYSDIIGVVGASEGITQMKMKEDVESSASDKDDQSENFEERQPRGHRNEDKEAKKVKH